MRVNGNGIIYAHIYLLTIQPFICDCENLTRKSDGDNLGPVKDAVRDIMIAGMELVDMINNWKHQPWAREMGFSNDCQSSNTCFMGRQPWPRSQIQLLQSKI